MLPVSTSLARSGNQHPTLISDHSRRLRGSKRDSMTDPSALPRPPVLVLAGGDALGAFQVGTYQALHENCVLPDWILGASIGAGNGALILGNPGDRRMEAL